MNVRIIANPIAGGGRGRILADALHANLQSRVDFVELILTKQAGDNEKEAQRPGADCVVAVGGDGSVNEVVNGIRGTTAALGILPAGTANVVAAELKIPSDPMVVANLIADTQHRIMDAGIHNNRRFLLGAGAGLDAAIVKHVSERRGKRSGLTKWVFPSIKTSLSYTFPRMRVEIDGQTVSEEGQYVIIGICRYSAGVFPATPLAKIEDGLFDVCVFTKLNPLKLATIAVTAPFGRHIRRRDVVHLTGQHVRLTPAEDGEVPLQIDGDPAGLLPAEFTIEHQAVRVIAPKPIETT